MQPNNRSKRRSAAAAWIEAMRLRTLPVSVAGVILADGFAALDRGYAPIPATLCLIFAILAQIASNFANEYYDFRAGLDAPGREGPRRGVTEGDITPRAMLFATYATLFAACAIGCSLILFSGWWIIPIGLLIAIGVVAYSTGPYPLSHHGLGEIAVILFFGVIPVCLTFYLQTGHITTPVILGSVSAGLMGANVLIINNYRDIDDDRRVKKHTLAVILGRRAMIALYAINAISAAVIMLPSWNRLGSGAIAIPAIYISAACVISFLMTQLSGHRLTPLLGITAMLMLLICSAFAFIATVD